MKKYMKKILAFLCAVVLVATTVLGNWYTKQAEAAIEPDPIQLDGFENVTLKDFKDGSNNAMEAGEYRSDRNSGNAFELFSKLADGSLDKKLVSMRIKYHGENENRYSLVFGGTELYKSFNLRPGNSGQSLYLDKSWGGAIANYTPVEMKASEAGVSSFVGDEFLLQMSFEYGEVINDKMSLTIGIYINGKLYNNTPIVISDCNASAVSGGLGVMVQKADDGTEAVITLDNVEIPAKPIQLDGFDNVTLKDFKDSSNNAMEAGEYRSDRNGDNALELFYKLADGSLDKKLVSMRIKYHGENDNRYSLVFGGTGTYASFNLRPGNSGQSLYLDKSWGDAIANYTAVEMKASEAGVSSFVGDEFLLQMSFEYGEVINDKMSLTIGIYINGKLYNNTPIVISDCNASAVSGGLGVMVQEADDGTKAVITLDNVEIPAKPIQLDGFDNLTLKDFEDNSGNQMVAGTYRSEVLENGTGNIAPYYSVPGLDNFNKKLVSMRIMFGGNEHYHSLIFGGKAADNCFNLRPGNNGECLFIDSSWAGNIVDRSNYSAPTMAASVAGLSSFVGEEFLLQMSFEYGAIVDNETTLTIGVYINGVLYNNEKFAIPNCNVNNLSDGLGVYLEEHNETDSIITLDNVEFPPSEGYKEVTVEDFVDASGNVMESKVYQEIAEDVETFSLAEGDNFDGKIISMSVQFFKGDGNSERIEIGSKQAWSGISVFARSDGEYLFVSNIGMPITSSNPGLPMEIHKDSVEGVTSFLEPFQLQMSFKYNDANGDGTDDQILLGVYINETLYNDTLYTLDVGDISKFGDCISLVRADAGTKLIVGSDMSIFEQPSESLEKVTFWHYGVDDGTYESATDLNVKGTYRLGDTSAGTVLCGNVQFHDGDQGEMHIFVGGGDDVWEGIRLTKYTESTELKLMYGSTEKKTFLPSVAGVDFTKDNFDLMWSVEWTDSDGDGATDDLKIGVWFNKLLYNQEYSYIEDYSATVGNVFATHCGAGTSITLNSFYELTKLPDKSLQKVSLSDFVHDGTENVIGSSTFLPTQDAAGNTDFAVKGNAKKFDSLVDKVLAFDVLQTGDVNTGANDGSKFDIILGSNVGHWYGLRLTTQESGMLTVGWLNSKDNWAGYYGITTDDVPVSSFVNETFNLMISMELFDNDGNDIQDLRVTLWFNEILYEGQDLIFTDCGHEVGNKFAVYVYPKTDVKQYVSLRSVQEYQSNPYYYANIAQYRKSTGYTYPEVEGKVFAGWYTDEDYNTPLKSTVTSGSAYAKFTDDEVLRVKSQIKLDSSNQKPTDKTTLRFVTTVDSLNYYRVGFKYKVEGENVEKDSYNSYPTTEDGKKLANKVYTQLQYIEMTDENVELMTYEPDAFSWQSKYFKAWNLADVQAIQYDQNVTISAYWITKDGTFVRGEERKICVNDSPSVDTSAATTIDFLGKDTMPIAGYGMWTASDLDGSDKNIFPDVNREMYFEMFADAGINLINYGSEDYAINPSDVLKQLEYGTKYGLGVFVNDSKLLDIENVGTLSERIEEYSSDEKYKSFSGIFLVDEPTTSDYGYSSDRTEEENRIYTLYESAAKLLNQQFENKDYLTYCNLFPIMDVDSHWWEDLWSSSNITDTDKNAYKSHIATINDKLNAKVISYDYYPFEDARLVDNKYDLNLYFWNLDVIRTQAIESSKPFWAYVQAGSQWKNYKSELSEDDDENEFTKFNGGYLKKEAFDEYYPSESQFNWIVNTSLAFGAQGIQYYPLIQPIQHAYDGVNAEYDFEVNGILSTWGGKTQWYYYAQEINKHIAEIDEVLMNAKTEKVVVPSSGNAYTQTKDLSSVATSYGVLSGVTGDALVGYFNYGGKVALYVANNQHWAVGEESSVTTQEVTLTLTDNYNEIIKYENAERTDDVATTNKQLTLTMEAGEGILLVLDGIQE